MNIRAYKMDVREIGDTGTFTGYASVFGNVDSYGTVVAPGAFKRTIDHHDGQFPLLFFHDPTRPIGMTQAEEDKKGLLVHGTIDLDIPDGRMTHSGMKHGYIDRMSIGFDVISDETREETTWFTELNLWEDSLITRNFAANPEALVTDVRAACVGLQRMNGAIRSGSVEELKSAMAELRTLLGPQEEEPNVIEQFRSEMKERMNELTALLTREGSALATLKGKDPLLTGSGSQSHPDPLEEMRQLRARLQTTLRGDGNA